MRYLYRILKMLLLVTLFSESLTAQSLATGSARNFFLSGTASTDHNGLLGFINPANNAMLREVNVRFFWLADRYRLLNNINEWGIFTAVSSVGFAALHQQDAAGNHGMTHYNISLSGGDRRSAFGVGYHWAEGERQFWERDNSLAVGWLYRPSPLLSLGMAGNFSTADQDREGYLDIGIRPLGTRQLMLFGDLMFRNFGDQKREWSVGAMLEVLPGIDFVGKYGKQPEALFSFGLNLSFGNMWASGRVHLKEGQLPRSGYGIGAGEYVNSVLAGASRQNKDYFKMTLQGKVDYNKYVINDPRTLRFMDILKSIRLAGSDAAVDVIALNLAELKILPEHAWEIREALLDAKKAGKKVVVFVENMNMTIYHLASAADRIVMDPEGSVLLKGYLLGRTYLKGTLEKLGIGFDEWRFFKYKSAAEALSQDRMSEADRVQSQAIVDNMYALMKQDVLASRSLSEAEFEKIVNERSYLFAEDAIEAGVVDTLGRWTDMEELIRSVGKGSRSEVSRRMLQNRTGLYQIWGNAPQIAVVYALGACAMNKGIKARHLEKVLLKLAETSRIKAIVLRVDSPGGDGMASDIVAEALKKCSKNKPVVVSQGQLAASGGYWLSMYGDSIVAAPNTITGSIGVIGGWVYDKGLTTKLGMSTDYVKKGKHADIGFGIRLPLGIKLASRNLTAEERSQVEHSIKQMYQHFVSKVASGRGMTIDEVEAIARGRVWSGRAGKEKGLVDELGGLMDAVTLARQMADISDEVNYEVLEIPKHKGFLNLDKLLPVSVGKQVSEEPVIQFLEMMIERPGFPYPMLLPGEYPGIEGE